MKLIEKWDTLNYLTDNINPRMYIDNLLFLIILYKFSCYIFFRYARAAITIKISRHATISTYIPT